MFLEVLVEGGADVPAVKSILERRFALTENRHFRLHPHRGKGSLPRHPNHAPNPRRRGLLDQLPAKLRGYSGLPEGYWLVVLVDADADDCRQLKKSLLEVYRQLPKRPPRVLFRIAVEETESWFLADPQAIRTAYPKSSTSKLDGHTPDDVVGAWELLAEVLGRRPRECSGGDKREWAEKIAPHLNLEQPGSPSLRALVEGLSRICGPPDRQIF